MKHKDEMVTMYENLAIRQQEDIAKQETQVTENEARKKDYCENTSSKKALTSVNNCNCTYPKRSSFSSTPQCVKFNFLSFLEDRNKANYFVIERNIKKRTFEHETSKQRIENARAIKKPFVVDILFPI